MSKFALFLLAAFPVLAELQEWRIDPGHSSASFSVRHMMVTTVRGQFGKLTGVMKFDPADPRTAVIEASIDAATIDTRNEKRDAHLRSADFFDTNQFPNITFKSTRVEPAAEGMLRVTGDLTIRNVTKPVTLIVEGPTAPVKDARGARIGASASAKISRKEFGITWNRAIETGGVAVSDEVGITIDAAFVQPAPAAPAAKPGRS
jgi:polyisoprenoid-binding protein YceI